MGIFDPIAEDLAWTWTGFQGLPRAGEVYYGRIIVGGLGCSGMWVRPEVKLPPYTNFAIDAAHPIRCFYSGNGGARTEYAADCPTGVGAGYFPYANSAYPSPAGNGGTAFWGFSPRTQSYWPLPWGKILYIEFPLVSTAQLSGFAGDDYLLGAVSIVDNSPGNASPVWVGHQQGWNGSGTVYGPKQGVFVQAPPPPVGQPPAPVITYMAYPEPASTGVTQTTADISLYYFNPACLDTNNSTAAMDIRQDTLLYKVVGGTASAPSGASASVLGCTSLAGINGAEGYSCQFRLSGLEADTVYLWKVELIDIGSCTAANVIADFPDMCGGAGGAACGPNVPTTDPLGADNQYREFRTLPLVPPPPLASLLTRGEGSGSLTVMPPGGRYAEGTTVTLTPTPDPGTHFVHWTVDGVPAGNSPTYTYQTNSESRAIVAVFAPNAPPAEPEPIAAPTGPVASAPPVQQMPPSDGAAVSAPPTPKKGCSALPAFDFMALGVALASLRRVNAFRRRRGAL